MLPSFAWKCLKDTIGATNNRGKKSGKIEVSLQIAVAPRAAGW